MIWIVQNLWLIPGLPMLAAGLSALAPARCRRFSAGLAIGAMALSLLLSLVAFGHALQVPGAGREVFNFPWFELGNSWLKIGWVLDPLSAVMLVMVTLVGLLIFIYSTGYMAHDANFTRFFTFLALFAGAMLGVIIANSLLLLFVCWELVGLTSYLLIGFWYHKPSAAAAAKKAFITTRIGDMALLVGMVWLFSETGTLLFYDNGAGCVEQGALAGMAARATAVGMLVPTAIGILIFAGAAGKSGQAPLHVWLPDAMEGPTPVSALIHAATMVAAGVYLVARVYPLMAAHAPGAAATTTALTCVTRVGAITAFFAATVAVTQNDIKRILAYSTVSQLGYMMIGLGTGGVAVGMFHLITHAFFKALLFMGAGSVIHGCHEEQDIRRMGGLRALMPVTFATYAVGMLALAGFPLVFSGFWSKDEILHAAFSWPVSSVPFYLGLAGALLTAFYMTRQVCYVFFGASRLKSEKDGHHPAAPHESPASMTFPLIVLAVFAVGLAAIGTPAWPWFQNFLGEGSEAGAGEAAGGSVIPLMIVSSLVVFAGLGIGWLVYGKKPAVSAESPDPLRRVNSAVYSLIENKYFIDELYEATVIRWNRGLARLFDLLDRGLWSGLVMVVSGVVTGISWLSRLFDDHVVNGIFNLGCERLSVSGKSVSRLQSGKLQAYLCVVGAALVILVILLAWGGSQ